MAEPEQSLPRDTEKETKNKAGGGGKPTQTNQKTTTTKQPPASCKSTAKPSQTPSGIIGQAKSQGRFWEEIQLPPWVIQNHSTLPSRGPRERPGTRPGTGAGSVLAARAVAVPSPPGYSLCRGCGTRGALRNICQLPGPRRQPARTSCLCFCAEHTPSGLCQR